MGCRQFASLEDEKMPHRLMELFPPFHIDLRRPPNYRGPRLRRITDEVSEDAFEDWMVAAADARTSA